MNERVSSQREEKAVLCVREPMQSHIETSKHRRIESILVGGAQYMRTAIQNAKENLNMRYGEWENTTRNIEHTQNLTNAEYDIRSNLNSTQHQRSSYLHTHQI